MHNIPAAFGKKVSCRQQSALPVIRNHLRKGVSHPDKRQKRHLYLAYLASETLPCFFFQRTAGNDTTYLPRHKILKGFSFLLFLPGILRKKEVIATLLCRLVKPLSHLAPVRMIKRRKQHADRIIFSLHKRSYQQVRMIGELLHRFRHLLQRLLAYYILLIQHSGYRRGRHARILCHISDGCHDTSPFPCSL